MSPSKLECLSKETLLMIAIILSALTPLGPPTDVLSMMLLSKAIHRKTHWPSVFVQIFLQKFDISAPVRRLGAECENPDALKQELALRFETLKRFRYYVRNDHVLIDCESLRRDMWKATLMFLECDGNNARQLVEYAHIDIFALKYISREGPLLRSAVTNGGWIVDDEMNSLAVGLFSYSRIGRVRFESTDQFMAVMRALSQPFADTSRYSFTLEPFTIATDTLTTSLRNSFHLDDQPESLASLLLNRTCVIPEHFGSKLRLAQPCIAESASVCILSRMRRLRLQEALRRLYEGGKPEPAQVGYLRAVEHEISDIVDWDEFPMAPGSMGSRRFDPDWARLYHCYHPQSQVEIRSRVLTAGALQGKWRGYLFDTKFEEAAAFDRRGWPTLAIHDRKIYPTPVEFELQEYHQHHKGGVFPFNDINYGPRGNEGILNAWFPSETTVTERETSNILKVSVDHYPRHTSLYQCYDPTSASPHNDPEAPYGNGVWDIIILGKETGAATGSYQYFGRVRSWDGLAVIVYGDIHMDLRRKRICYGYLRGYNNIVGRWRSCATRLDEREWSGAWTMTRCL